MPQLLRDRNESNGDIWKILQKAKALNIAVRCAEDLATHFKTTEYNGVGASAGSNKDRLGLYNLELIERVKKYNAGLSIILTGETHFFPQRNVLADIPYQLGGVIGNFQKYCYNVEDSDICELKKSGVDWGRFEESLDAQGQCVSWVNPGRGPNYINGLISGAKENRQRRNNLYSYGLLTPGNLDKVGREPVNFDKNYEGLECLELTSTENVQKIIDFPYEFLSNYKLVGFLSEGGSRKEYTQQILSGIGSANAGEIIHKLTGYIDRRAANRSEHFCSVVGIFGCVASRESGKSRTAKLSAAAKIVLARKYPTIECHLTRTDLQALTDGRLSGEIGDAFKREANGKINNPSWDFLQLTVQGGALHLSNPQPRAYVECHSR